MKITALELTNIRGFKKLEKTEFSEKINVFIGPNNSGKSTILNSIFVLQRKSAISNTDITLGEKKAEIRIFYKGNHNTHVIDHQNVFISIDPEVNRLSIKNMDGRQLKSFDVIPDVEPNNLIYPYLSKRKTVAFQNQINAAHVNSVLGNFQNLYSKIDRIITPQYQPANSEYINACNEILGFEISTLASPNGKKGVYFVHNQEHIPLEAMGEGVTNIIGLITDLCVAENKIFIIEEPENDIHPTALKALLKFIVAKSDTNQFFISTHSNIVMKYLGAVKESKIFNVSSELSDTKFHKLFISRLKEVSNDPEERKIVLESLGYEFNDFGVWSAWLFLEESSAEVLIKEWFIKWYTPEMKDKLRTYSANSLSHIIPKFDDFNKLFVFLYLEPLYKNKVWVITDNGKNEKEVIDKLKEVYKKSGWNEENFSQFSEHDFEKYYPSIFQEMVNNALEEKDKQKKRQLKKELLEEVKQWIKDNEQEAKKLFELSAKPVIIKLKEIASKI
jgi:AAA15 family ATPase/GTPase